MKDFEFYKTIRLSDGVFVRKSFSKINEIYNIIPETTGCLENICKQGGCNGWCCRLQTPQLLYSEFLMIWDLVSTSWSNEQVCDIFEKCMRNAINDIPSKGCVFFDSESNMCKIHKVRPYNCRIYGITPPEEFNPRYEKLKEKYKNIIGAKIKPQCELVSVVGDKKLTTKKTNEIWERLKANEMTLGIPMTMITDEFGGTYRTPHDHILLYNMPENVLNALAGIQLYSDHLERIRAVDDIMSHMRNYFKGIAKNEQRSKS